MERCFKCGVSSDRKILYDAISEKEIVKICERCNASESLPIIRKSNISEEPEKRISVRERLSYLSGINPDEVRKKRDKISAEQNEKLREIANKNYLKEINKAEQSPEVRENSGMIRNFHWLIMRERRARKLTQKQLAEMIYEPEAAIRMAEKGILPRERENLVKKIENALRIKITDLPEADMSKLKTDEIRRNSEPHETEELEENPEDAEGLDFREKEKRWTIGDLLRIKKRVKAKDNSEKGPSQEEIDKVLEENSKE